MTTSHITCCRNSRTLGNVGTERECVLEKRAIEGRPLLKMPLRRGGPGPQDLKTTVLHRLIRCIACDCQAINCPPGLNLSLNEACYRLDLASLGSGTCIVGSLHVVHLDP